MRTRLTAPSQSNPTASLSLLTANLHRNTRSADLRLFAAKIRRDLDPPPDFICVQEAMFSPAGGDWSSPGVLAKHLGYAWAGRPRGIGSVEGSAILSRYPFAFYKSKTLKSSPSRWKLGFRRMCVMGEFRVPNVGYVRVVNVHFQDGPMTGPNRQAQMDETVNWMRERNATAPAAVNLLAGDFNAPADAAEFAALRATVGDMTFQSVNTATLTKFAKGTTQPVLRLDDIFIAPGDGIAVARGSETVLWRDGLQTASGGRRFVSDHLPVLHRFEITQDASE